MQYIDLCFYYVLLQPEAWNSVHEHTAGSVFFLEHRRLISFDCQIVRTTESGRTATYNCNFFFKFSSNLWDDLAWDESRLAVQILLSYEALYLINRYSLINSTSGTCVFTSPVANSAANCRERIVPLNQLKSFSILSLSRQLQITLNSYVCRTCGLTW